MKSLIPFALTAGVLVMGSPQSAGHPFDAARISPSIDSFVVVTRVTNGAWRPVAGVIQTIARGTDALRLSVDYASPDSKQRVEMAMHPQTLAPIAHWETLSRSDGGETRGAIQFRDGRAQGAFIVSKRVFDVAVDSGVVDNDASTALLTALPLAVGRSFAFRTFGSPGVVERTRVVVEGIETVTAPAGRIESYRLIVMARDTSQVFISREAPAQVVLVRVGDGSQEMRLVNRRQ